MSYDVIIKFETLEEDSQYLIEQCGLDDRFETFPQIEETNIIHLVLLSKILHIRSAFIVRFSE